MPAKTAPGGWPSTTCILKEFHHDRQVPAFLEYTKQFTDAPHLVEISKIERRVDRPARCCAPTGLEQYKDVENGEWKFLMWDERPESTQDVPWAASVPAGATRKRANGTSS